MNAGIDLGVRRALRNGVPLLALALCLALSSCSLVFDQVPDGADDVLDEPGQDEQGQAGGPDGAVDYDSVQLILTIDSECSDEYVTVHADAPTLGLPLCQADVVGPCNCPVSVGTSQCTIEVARGESALLHASVMSPTWLGDASSASCFDEQTCETAVVEEASGLFLNIYSNLSCVL